MKDTLYSFTLEWHSSSSIDKSHYVDKYLKDENIDINTLVQKMAHFINLSERNSFSYRNCLAILNSILLLANNKKNTVDKEKLDFEQFDFDTLKIFNNHYSVINTLNTDIIQKGYQRKYKNLSHSNKEENSKIFMGDTLILVSRIHEVSHFTKEIIMLNSIHFLQNSSDIRKFKDIIREINFSEINPLSYKYQDLITVESPKILINNKVQAKCNNLICTFLNNPISFEEFDQVFVLKKPLKKYMDEYFDTKNKKEKKFYHFLHEITFQLDKVLYLKEKEIKRSLQNGDNNLHRLFYYLDKEQCVDTINYYIAKGDKPFVKNNAGKNPFEIFWFNREKLDVVKALDNFLRSDCFKMESAIQVKNFIKSCKESVDSETLEKFSIMYDKKVLLKGCVIDELIIEKKVQSRL